MKKELKKKIMKSLNEKILPDIVELKREMGISEVSFEPTGLLKINEENNFVIKETNIGSAWEPYCNGNYIRINLTDSIIKEFCEKSLSILADLKQEKKLYDDVIGYETKYKHILLTEKIKHD